MPKSIYRAHHAIPEFGIRPGDTIIADPSHPRAPVKMVRSFDRNQVPQLLPHLDGFTLIETRESEHDPGDRVSFQRKQHRHWIRLVK
jgi:hypothetical protein